MMQIDVFTIAFLYWANGNRLTRLPHTVRFTPGVSRTWTQQRSGSGSCQAPAACAGWAQTRLASSEGW